ncbi:MAG TPA: hypothetical protein VEP90_10610 [Methylomirabilota bacterium]|nr:hypothetical protein [Methylomirabilota bacterium]
MIIPLLNIKSCLPKLLYFSVGAVILNLLSSTLVTNELYAQISPNTQHSAVPSNSTAQPLQHQQQVSQKIHVVKITSPAKGQQVVVDKNLIVSGTSIDNTTSDCGVSVIVNGVKPYRLASANGGAGPKDYSKWNFTLTPAYTSIKQGQNKITAKFSCTNDPNLISHSSVNVTGVGTSLTPIATQQKQNSTGKNSTTTNVNTTSTGKAISPVTSSSSSQPKVASTNNNTNSGSTMSVSIHLAKKSVQPGDKQTVIIKVTDLNSTSPVVGASVLGRVTDPSGGSFKKLAGTTDDTGKSSYSWTVSQGDTPGKYKTIIEVSANGYKNNTASKTFQVIPVTTITTGNNSLIHLFPNANNSTSHKNSPSTIIPIPHIRIPTIKIPFHLPFQ